MLKWIDPLDQDVESEQEENNDFGEHFAVPNDHNIQQRKPCVQSMNWKRACVPAWSN